MKSAPRPPRPFTMYDAMTLIAALATGLGYLRLEAAIRSRQDGNFLEGWTQIGPMTEVEASDPWTTPAVVAYACTGLQLVVPIVSMFSIALLGLRFRRPRPRLHRIVTQPGTVACAAASLAIVFGAIGEAWDLLDRLQAFRPEIAEISALAWNLIQAGLRFGCQPFAAFGVTLGWAGLALGGRLRAERSWIDRAGLVMGLLWTLIYPTYHILDLIETTWPGTAPGIASNCLYPS